MQQGVMDEGAMLGKQRRPHEISEPWTATVSSPRVWKKPLQQNTGGSPKALKELHHFLCSLPSCWLEERSSSSSVALQLWDACRRLSVYADLGSKSLLVFSTMSRPASDSQLPSGDEKTAPKWSSLFSFIHLFICKKKHTQIKISSSSDYYLILLFIKTLIFNLD